MPRTSSWLICYDITSPRRLARVHRCVSRVSLQIQYSVYLFRGTAEQLDALLDRVEKRIRPALDDVRVYPVPRHPRVLLGGRNLADSSLFLFDAVLGDFAGPASRKEYDGQTTPCRKRTDQAGEENDRDTANSPSTF